MNFREWLAGATSQGAKPIVPGWLRNKFGKAFFQVIGFALDTLTSDARAAQVWRLPSYASPSSLPYVGDGRSIDRYFADTDQTYQIRVKNAWDLWFRAGSKQRLIDAITAMGHQNVRIYSYAELGGAVPDRWRGWTSAFWVFIGPPTAVLPSWTWGTGNWGDTVAGHLGAPAGPRVWGATGINWYEVQQLRNAIRKWKQGHEICAEIVFVSSGRIWEPGGGPWGGGGVTWGPAVVTRIDGSDRGHL